MKRILTACFLFCVSSLSWSNTIQFFHHTWDARFYVGAGAGQQFYQVSGNNYVNTGAGWPPDYYSSPGISNEPFGFLGLGFAFTRPTTWWPSFAVGVRYSNISSTNIAGYIDQYSSPIFRNYRYNYDLQIQTFLFNLKATIYTWHHLMPYLLVGAGPASYRVSHYQENALSGVTPRVSPGFQDNNENNLAYQLGLGVEYMVQDNLSANVEFDYVNYGTINTANGVNYSTLTGVNYDDASLKNKIAATSLLIGLTYYIA